MPRQLFVTTALPYANAGFHIGHMMEYIQADTWVRFQRMQGVAVDFVCADDTHGAPIMIAAEKAGKTPQQFVADIAAGRKQYLDGFHISFDNWHSTDAPENHELARQIYRDLRDHADGSLIEVRTIEQFFDPEKNMFLPDRYIKGECPKCHAKDQYGDNCEVCGSVYAPTDLINPFSVLSGARPELKNSEHFFFKLSDPRCVAFLEQWTQDGKLQPEVANKIKEWFSVRTNPDGTQSEGLGDWDISRDAPYFGIEIPDAPGKYFYVWLDAPIGYLASLKNLLGKRGLDYDAYMANPELEQYHFIGKDIVTFHTLFWPATLHFSGRKTPDNVFVHGFLTVNNGEKMSKSRGTGLDPLKYLSLGMNPEWLRYYLAAKLSARNEDIDFNADDFMARVNSDLIGKFVNIASRAAGFLTKRFGGAIGEVPEDGAALLHHLRMEHENIARLYEQREFAKVMREVMLLADRVNAYVDANKPWDLAKHADMDARLQGVCSVCIKAFRVLTCYLKPVMPALAQQVEKFLNIPALSFSNVTEPLPANHVIGSYQHLMQRWMRWARSSGLVAADDAAGQRVRGGLPAPHFGTERHLGVHYALLNMTSLSFVLVYTGDHALVFLLGWEIAALAAWLLVIWDYTNQKVRFAGFNYLVSTHIGLMFLVAAFMILYTHSASWELGSFGAGCSSTPGRNATWCSCCW
jgi:methionyl-tRNA synthetase